MEVLQPPLQLEVLKVKRALGVANIRFNDDYTITFYTTDGRTYRTESIRGEKGEVGNGIASATINDDYTLTLKFTDGTSYTTHSIRGAKGEQGEKGDPGESFELHICSSVEYDHETRIPTVARPRSNVLYLVPSDEGFNTDLFVEWVYIYNAWEKFGSASINLDAYAKKTDLDAKLNKPESEGYKGQVLTSDGDGGQTWESLPTPDWNAANGIAGFIKNKPDLKAGTGTDSVNNRHSVASGTKSFAVGNNNTVSGENSFGTGASNTIKGSGTIASGTGNVAENRSSNNILGGTSNTVSGTSNIVSGTSNNVSTDNAFASGKQNTVSGLHGAAFGLNNTASGQYSHAEGRNTIASGEASYAEGYQTTASGKCSHAEGELSSASGISSHAEGLGSIASGLCSHAEGELTTASGWPSHAEGNTTIASHKCQHVFGEYNVKDPSEAVASARGNYIEIVGNGTGPNDKSNARTLDWSGNEWIKGNFKIGGNSYDDPNAKELATKEYVDEEVAKIPKGEKGDKGDPGGMTAVVSGTVLSIY